MKDKMSEHRLAGIINGSALLFLGYLLSNLGRNFPVFTIN